MGEILVEATAPPVLGELLRNVLLNNRTLEGIEIPCALPDGKSTTLRIHAQRVNYRQDALVLLELRDVTSEREKQRLAQDVSDVYQQHGVDLEGINAELETFSHSVSHDLRTPLRFTNKIAHLLLREHGPGMDSAAVAKLHMILESTEEMATLIEDLLMFSQINRQPIKMQRVDIRRVAQEAVDDLADEYAGRKVTIVVGELPASHGDHVLLKQVFLNLLTNAIKFTRTCDKAEICVGSNPGGDENETVYFVRDNGVGFDMQFMEPIFIPFRRLAQARPVEGSGIGLALVRRIVERHGGSIWAEAAPGSGATFYFTLPGPTVRAPKGGIEA